MVHALKNTIWNKSLINYTYKKKHKTQTVFISIYKNREQGQYWEVNNAKMQKLKDYVLGGKNVFNLCMLERGIKKVSK